jgi:hypothetical protein
MGEREREVTGITWTSSDCNRRSPRDADVFHTIVMYHTIYAKSRLGPFSRTSGDLPVQIPLTLDLLLTTFFLRSVPTLSVNIYGVKLLQCPARGKLHIDFTLVLLCTHLSVCVSLLKC